MGDTFIISGLKKKRSEVSGRILDLRHEISLLQADLLHIDEVLKIYGLEPEEIPTKGRMPKRSEYFGRNEISRRCYDLLREKGVICAEDVARRAMQEKGLDPDVDTSIRTDFTKRVLVSLNDFCRTRKVEKLGFGRGVRWRLTEIPEEEDEISTSPPDASF